MKEKKIIGSLHRPFNTRLITCKWVCSFAQEYDGSNFKNDFFIHTIDFLHKQYTEKKENISGLPAKETVEILYEYIINNSNIDTNLSRFGNPSKKNHTDIDKKLFSNLKAVSYYITLSKNLGLIGSKYSLTDDGLIFARLRNSSIGFMNLTSKEKKFLTQKVFENDLIPFLFGLNYYRLKKKYQLSNTELIETNSKFLELLDSFLEIREFRYKQSSWINYIKVRESWIEDLELLSKSSYTLKPIYLKLIESNIEWQSTHNEIIKIMIEFEKNLFKTLEKYRDFKLNLYRAYTTIKKNMFFDNIGYVNLYDIKKELHISFNDLENMLNRLTTDENSRKKVFFNNIISAVDNRKRFQVKNTLVLNIRIKEELK